MKTLKLPRMSTDKPYKNYKHHNNGECTNHLHQEFNQQMPNIVWASDFTYIKVAGKWYYLCIVMDLFSRKVISWNLSGKPDADLVMSAFQKAYDKRNRKTYHSLQELQLSIFEYIEGYYNSRRPHGSLGMLTPNEREELFWNQV